MYNCDKTKEMLSSYIDNELSQSEKKYVAKHLLNCADCKREYDDLIFLISELSTTKLQPLPLDFKQKLHNRLVMENKMINRKSRKNNWAMYSSVAAGVLLTILIGTGYYQRFQPIENAYVNDAQIEVSEKIADVEQNTKQKQDEQNKPTATEPPTKKANTQQKIVQSPKPVEPIPQTVTQIPTATTTPKPTPTSEIIANKPVTDEIPKMTDEKVALKSAMPETAQPPAVTEKSSTGSGGGGAPIMAMSARSFAEIIYKTANIKVENFKVCADEINQKHGSIIEDSSIVLYVNDQDLEAIINIAKKYNAVIIYDNVSTKNPTNKCIISSK